MDDGSLIVLAQDLDLLSLRNGAADIFWSAKATWGAALGARGIRLYGNVLGLGAGTSVAFVGQYGADGRSWTTFYRQIDGRTASNPIDATGQFVVDYAADPAEFAPKTRFGVQVTGDTVDSVQGTARLTAIVVPIFHDSIFVSFAMASATALLASQTKTLLGDRALVATFNRSIVIVDISSFAGANNIVVTIQGSDDNSNFFDLTSSAAITANGLYPIIVDPLARYIRAVYTSGAGTTATATVTAELKQL